MIQDAGQKLVNWLNTPKNKEAEVVEAEVEDDDDFMAGLDDPLEEKEPSCPKALDLIKKMFDHPKVKKSEKVQVILTELKSKHLKKGDAQYIMDGIKKAVAGDFAEIEDLLRNR